MPTFNVLARAPARIKPAAWGEWGDEFFQKIVEGQTWTLDRVASLQAHVTCPAEGEEELARRLWALRTTLLCGLVWFPLNARTADPGVDGQ